MEWVWSRPNLEKPNKTPRHEFEDVIETALSDTLHRPNSNNTIYTRNRISKATSSNEHKYNFIQKVSNPYMIKNNYIKDLQTQDMFLRPMNSNYNFKYEK